MTDELEGSSSPAMALRCPNCSLPFEPGPVGSFATVDCSACRSSLSAFVFPGLYSPPEEVSTATGERAAEGEAVCFFHPEKRAERSCDRCGRFVCALCDLPLGGKHLCPKCLDSSKVAELIPTRFVGGYFAMLCGWIPVIFLPIFLGCFYVLPVTGGTAIGFALWSWKQPGSLVEGQRHGLALLGILGGIIQLIIIAGLVGLMVYGFKHAG